jgi:N-acetylglutamate synthase-like GNAT family acetyltransferase
LKYVFACTSEERVAGFFARLGFEQVGAGQVSSAKWRGYDPARIAHLSIFRSTLD